MGSVRQEVLSELLEKAAELQELGPLTLDDVGPLIREAYGHGYIKGQEDRADDYPDRL